MAELIGRPDAGRVYAGRRRVRLADASPAGRLRLDAAARFLQDVSADDTADAALPDAEAWVVRQTSIEVTTFPRYLETIRLATWCSGTGSHWAERRISIEGDEGGAIEAVSTWVHIDPASGRPQRLSPGFHEIYGSAARGRRVTARLDHPDLPEGAQPSPPPHERLAWPLRFSDFDVLGHVNNAATWQAVEELLAARPQLRAPLRAEVQHRTSIERGAVVEVVAADEDGGLRVWLLADGRVAVTAVVTARPKAP